MSEGSFQPYSTIPLSRSLTVMPNASPRKRQGFITVGELLNLDAPEFSSDVVTPQQITAMSAALDSVFRAQASIWMSKKLIAPWQEEAQQYADMMRKIVFPDPWQEIQRISNELSFNLEQLNRNIAGMVDHARRSVELFFSAAAAESMALSHIFEESIRNMIAFDRWITEESRRIAETMQRMQDCFNVIENLYRPGTFYGDVLIILGEEADEREKEDALERMVDRYPPQKVFSNIGWAPETERYRFLMRHALQKGIAEFPDTAAPRYFSSWLESYCARCVGGLLYQAFVVMWAEKAPTVCTIAPSSLQQLTERTSAARRDGALRNEEADGDDGGSNKANLNSDVPANVALTDVLLRPQERPGKSGPTETTLARASVFRRIKEANFELSQNGVAQAAMKDMEWQEKGLGVATEDTVRNTYRRMGWEWERGERSH